MEERANAYMLLNKLPSGREINISIRKHAVDRAKERIGAVNHLSDRVIASMLAYRALQARAYGQLVKSTPHLAIYKYNGINYYCGTGGSYAGALCLRTIWNEGR